MIVKAVYVFEFDVDTSEMNPKFIDIDGISKELTRRELDRMIIDGEIDSSDFDITIDKDAKSIYPPTGSCLDPFGYKDIS